MSRLPLSADFQPRSSLGLPPLEPRVGYTWVWCSYISPSHSVYSQGPWQLLSPGKEKGAFLERLGLDPTAGLCSRFHAVRGWRAACGAPGWDRPAGTTLRKELGSATGTGVRGALRHRLGSPWELEGSLVSSKLRAQWRPPAETPSCLNLQWACVLKTSGRGLLTGLSERPRGSGSSARHIYCWTFLIHISLPFPSAPHPTPIWLVHFPLIGS